MSPLWVRGYYFDISVLCSAIRSSSDAQPWISGSKLGPFESEVRKWRWYDVTDTSEDVFKTGVDVAICKPGFRRRCTRMFDLATIRSLQSGNKGTEFDLQTGLTALRFGSSVL
jgi:hypothetical protein